VKYPTSGERILQDGGEFGEGRLKAEHALSVDVQDGVVQVVLPAELHRLVHVHAALTSLWTTHASSA